MCTLSGQLASVAASDSYQYRLRPPTAGMFGYSHLTGGYPGGQAEYVRVPFGESGSGEVAIAR